jgi:hypothetical protein
MLRRKRIQNFTDKIHRLYDGKFSYIESVLNSCTTLDQLKSGTCWGFNVVTQFMTHEKKRLHRLCSLVTYIELSNAVTEYFELKRDIVGLIFNRKVREIEGQEPGIDEE